MGSLYLHHRVFWGLKWHVKYLDQCPAHSKYSISLRNYYLLLTLRGNQQETLKDGVMREGLSVTEMDVLRKGWVIMWGWGAWWHLRLERQAEAGLGRVLWAILGSLGSNSSLGRLLGWQSQLGGERRQKAEPITMWQPYLGEDAKGVWENHQDVQKVSQ